MQKIPYWNGGKLVNTIKQTPLVLRLLVVRIIIVLYCYGNVFLPCNPREIIINKIRSLALNKVRYAHLTATIKYIYSMVQRTHTRF